MADQINWNSMQRFGVPVGLKETYAYIGGVPGADNARISTITYTKADGSTAAVVTLTWHGSTNNIATMERTT